MPGFPLSAPPLVVGGNAFGAQDPMGADFGAGRSFGPVYGKLRR